MPSATPPPTIEVPVVGGTRDGRHERVDPTQAAVTFVDPEPFPTAAVTDRVRPTVTTNRSIYYLDYVHNAMGEVFRFLRHSGTRRDAAMAILRERFPTHFPPHPPGRITE